MRNDTMTTHAVLTGDLVGSTKVARPTLEACMDHLRTAAQTISIWTGMEPLRFTRFRGDGWQVILNQPQFAVRAGLLLIASLTAADDTLTTRIAIGMGSIDSLGTQDLGDASGPAFIRSGRALDQMKPDHSFVLIDPNLNLLRNVVTSLLGERSGRWSRLQAQAMVLALDPARPTLQTMATRVGVTLQSVSYRLRSAGWPTIHDALSVLESTHD